MQSKIPINRMKSMQMKVGENAPDQSLMNIYLGISIALQALLNYVRDTRFMPSEHRWNAPERSAIEADRWSRAYRFMKLPPSHQRRRLRGR